jgi:hypothetical protein
MNECSGDQNSRAKVLAEEENRRRYSQLSEPFRKDRKSGTFFGQSCGLLRFEAATYQNTMQLGLELVAVRHRREEVYTRYTHTDR